MPDSKEIQAIKDGVDALDDDALVRMAWQLLSTGPEIGEELRQLRREELEHAVAELRRPASAEEARGRLRSFCLNELIWRPDDF